MFQCVRTPVEALYRDFDASRLTASEAVLALRELATIRNAIDGLIGRVGVQIEESGAHKMRGERSAPAFVARELGERVGDVRELLDAASKVRLLPQVSEAVRDGRLSARQTRMIAAAAAENPAAQTRLLHSAEQGLVQLKDAVITARAEVEDPAERPARQRKLRGLHTYTDENGMVAGHFRLTPEVGGQFLATIDKETQRIFRSRRSGTDHEPLSAYAADALVNLVLGEPKAKNGTDIRMHLVLDYEVLKSGWPEAGETCEIPGVGPVDVSWVRSLLGSAFLTAVIKKGKDITTVAHLGRHVPVEVETALVVQGHECGITGCGLRGYLERDHRHDFAKGGPTALDNPRNEKSHPLSQADRPGTDGRCDDIEDTIEGTASGGNLLPDLARPHGRATRCRAAGKVVPRACA